MTKDEYNRLLAASSTKKNKYGALRSGGYASRREHLRALQLRQMQRAGLISGLREQVRYELIPAQYRDGELAFHPCSYIADFVYTDNATGAQVVEDAKGFPTDEYKIKRKLMLHVHGILIKET